MELRTSEANRFRKFGILFLKAIVTVLPLRVAAVPLDSHGEIGLGLRTYALTRVGSDDMKLTDNEQRLEGSFPASSAGHVRQLRAFLEIEWKHDLDRLGKTGVGPFALLQNLPFRVSGLKYNLVFRGEYEGLYDFGPKEFRTAEAFRSASAPIGNAGLPPESVAAKRHELRHLATDRERLFQAYVEAEVGGVAVRFGRQILAWGETDIFRLLDNINPTDSSFGGFLIPLDERRVPLDMLRLNYTIGQVGPFADVFLEGYGAVGDEVGYSPRIPYGSPWAPGIIGYPNDIIYPVLERPAKSLTSARGGAQIKGNLSAPQIGGVTLGLAHYYTRVDIPAVQNYARVAFQPLPDTNDALIKSVLTAPTVQVTGASASFVIPAPVARAIGLSGEPVVRSELAYLHDEPRYSQSQLDPLVFVPRKCRTTMGAPCSGGRRVGDSWNFSFGIDHNQYIRFLNPDQTIFFSAQFFYKHLRDAVKRQVIPGSRGIVDGEVYPVFQLIDKQNLRLPFVHNPVDQYINTLLVTTSYFSAQVSPLLVVAYDWSGAVLAVPQVNFSRDPFRAAIGYAAIEANRWYGASGISLLRDRDNFFFQIEYVL